ncbi:MAG TPA: aminoglycoside phosphotransferase family protein [bacterium]|nr:aminoglycoside phosphotransferase family protein [bacterium]
MRSADLERLVRGGAWKDRVAHALAARDEAMPDGEPEIAYVRFKPDVGCLLGVQSPGGPLGYLKLFTDADAAAECAAKYGPREANGGWVELLADGTTAFFRFPLDRNVRGLRFVTDMDRLKHLLHAGTKEFAPDGLRVRGSRSRAELLKYKPERRCIARAELAVRDERTGERGRRRVVAQANGDDTGAEVLRVLRHLHDRPGSGALRSPRPLGYDTANRVLLLEWVEGEELGDVLGDPRAEVACSVAGMALRELHSLPFPSGPPVRRAESVRERVLRILFDLARTGGGDLASRAKDLEGRLPRALDDAGEAEPRILHGDFYFHQIILGPDGCRVIDWDETALGDPRTDVANFLAHLHLREIQGVLDAERAGRLRDSFLDGHRDGGPAPAGLDVLIAAQLTLLCLSPFRNLEPDWREQCAAILDRAQELLGAGTGARR